MGEIGKKSNTLRLALENTQKELPIENEQVHPGVIYDTSLENTLSNMKNQKGFFNIEDKKGDIFWNGFPVETLGGYKLENNEVIYNISDSLQKVITITANLPLKKLIDIDKEIYNNILKNLDFENYQTIRGETKSVRYKYSETNFKGLKNQGIDKIIIPSKIFDIYSSLEISPGLKISGHTDTLTEASNLIDKIYKRREIQIEQQYRNAPNKFHT